MDGYVLAKIVQKIGEVDARKRLQKVIFLLETKTKTDLAGDYTLHLYGPYSRGVADETDRLVQGDILSEERQAVPWGTQYSYKLAEHGTEAIREFEDDPANADSKEFAEEIAEQAKMLAENDLWHLELASTMAYFRKIKSCNWEDAVQKAAEFKRVDAKAPVLEDAGKLAQEWCD
ncbi:MAG: hypothetical protein ACOCVI_02855 [Planctomycetota bacterium]